MTTKQFILPLAGELFVDLFAGGGGWSSAFEMATGQHPHIAINHDDDAISMHEMNHPQSQHYQADIFEVCPRNAVGDMPVGWMHLSPDCTHHSQAKGGQPRDRKIRALSWVGIRWAGQVRPRIISLENVRQVLNWGPLVAKRCKDTGRVIRLDGTVAPKGERTPVNEQFLVPCKKRSGETWKRFVSILRSMGYEVEWQRLVAADYGAPTTRDRLFLMARCDGEPIVWPEPTHFKEPKRGQKRWRAAAECIDWGIPGRSIFNRPRPLADATMRRIARGVKRFVLDSGDPFIVKFRGDSSGVSIHEPLHTISAGGQHHGVVECELSTDDEANALQVAAFMINYYGNGDARDLDAPMDTVTTRDRLALVTVHIQGTPYVIVDIKLRMLEPHELYAAQGFPPSYIITHGHDGRKFSKSAQVRMCGNSVSPPPAMALIQANWNDRDQIRKVA